ncbi:MJ1255/VC2487 family glycosyltransferase [Shewanella xiamenensis]|uniref:MJ1255/VC2487 family glycosyltransferase n=1 Tax=Shewanella xiamenensis TaxID=332186 RepID=UPI0011866B42|nr:MJ1255/VC2487 family glycosyltransferase [Shewanella xiamenensis]MDI5837352.1 glycosyltransferase [Shewanella xiamenensis]MDI5841545.1 glycosyltransferase [Shewanella xiamenensis]MDI5845291.1 glycosyltransferase [Shewanella xiamenensis]MDI5848782.1 glycosyltransferase [Shewanella xiamenensis]MDI5853320.1 glycosyltransferase [Shewanella xiamenensis]
MRILYGVQGTGNGHLSRARVMAKALVEHNIQVDFLFSGRKPEDFFDMECFGDYRVQAGMTFATHSGRVNITQTVKQNCSLSLLKDIQSLDLSCYDLVLNDFEPVSAWAARRQGVPSIGISHQVALTHPVPKLGSTWLNELLLNYFAPVDVALGCHWHHFGFPILPPFVEVDVSPIEHTHQILVYLPFEEADVIADFFKPFTDYQFLVYHAKQPTKRIADHIQWHGFNRDGFKQHLATCGGVIGNAGFELASEALTLGKKLLVKPLIGQFEQLSNVAALQLLGAGDSMMSLDISAVKRWLKAASPNPIAYPQVGDALVKWIGSGQWQNTTPLCADLWSQVKLPDTWR